MVVDKGKDDHGPAVPLYKAAETEMIRRIESGEWAPGLRLPNEFGLADEFGVSQGTMRRAPDHTGGNGAFEPKAGAWNTGV